MSIRPMVAQDIGFALELTSHEGWSDIDSDFQALLTYPITAAFVMEANNQKIGMIGAVCYGKIGFIGSFIIHKDHRKKGYGSTLFDYAIQHLQKQGVKLALLDAVENAKEFYEGKGFKSIFYSHRFRGRIKGETSNVCRRMNSDDLEAITNMDRTCFGENREHFLKQLLKHHSKFCYVAESDNQEIVGFVFASKRNEYHRIGPFVLMKDRHLARNLLLSIPYPGKSMEVRIGVPGYNTDALKLYRENNIPESEGSIRMGLGDISLLAQHMGQYAIGSPAKG